MNLKKKLIGMVTMIFIVAMAMTFTYGEETEKTEHWKWVTNANGTRYESENDYAKNKWLKIEGEYYFFNEEGYIEKNCYIQGYWLNEEGKWVKAYSGGKWYKDSTGWWYQDNGWYPVNSWQKIDGNYYHFDERGYMEASCYTDGYWINSEGIRNKTPYTENWTDDENGRKWGDNNLNTRNRWLKIEGEYYYFNKEGYIEKNCYIQGCWLNEEGKWIKAYSRGKWYKDSTGWWYQDNSWYPVNSWQKIDGNHYYFNSYGYMESSAYVKGRWLNSSGAWDKNYSDGHWVQNGTGWWYEDNGWYPTNQKLRIDCATYYFDSNGYMATDYIVVSIMEQMLYYYNEGSLKLKTPIVTGNYGDYNTPKGMYRIGNKARNIYLTGPGYRSYVNYWMPFIGNSYGFHDAQWRSSFGGRIYLTNGSHGCVNMPYTNAMALFNMITSNKTLVIIE